MGTLDVIWAIFPEQVRTRFARHLQAFLQMNSYVLFYNYLTLYI